jgi:hypothetical protein
MRSLQKMAVVAGLAAMALPLVAQEIPQEGPVPTTALISIDAKNGATLDPSALVLQVNRHNAPITSVTPITRGPVQIAILVDDGLRQSFALHLDEMKKFLLGLPPNAQVMLGYMQNGTVRSAGRGFTNNHEEVASQLRIPFSSAGISASPYFCLSDFVKQWPSQQPGARIVLMLTNGVDPYNGSTSPLNQDSPYVQTAQNDAQRAGVAVYSIYYGDSGFRGGRGSFSGQSYLQQVAEATGAESYNQGTITPPSISPYLEKFQKALMESYLVSFQANASREKRDTLTEIKVSTKQSGIKVHAPESVHPGIVE